MSVNLSLASHRDSPPSQRRRLLSLSPEEMLMLVLTIAGVFIAAVAATVALWQGFILRRQLDNDLLIRSASFHQSVSNLLRELDLIFLNNPGLRPYFYYNIKPSGPLIEQQTLALAEYIMDLIESCTAAENADPSLLRGGWDDYFNYLYRHSYAMRRYWEDFGHLYPPDVKRAVLGPSASPKRWPQHMEHGAISDPDADKV
jgi:hypothetical protein